MSKEELSVNGTGKIFTDKQPQITFANLNPKNQKVIIWGYELCNGAEWKDFLEVVNKLGKEKAELEKALELACDKIADLIDRNGCGAWFYDFNSDDVIDRDGFEDFYKRYAKEKMKSE